MPEIRTSSGQEEIGVAGSRLREGQAAAPSLMEAERAPLLERLLGAGVDRRAFLSYCAGITVALALPPRFAPRVAEALAMVEGSVPIGDGGVYCTIGGKTAQQRLKEATKGAAAVVNVGTCSSFGGIPAAAPNPTGAVGVPDLVSGVPVLNLPGCPVNADNLTATLAHYLTFGELPAADDLGRPLFAYGERIHDACPRRGHFDAGSSRWSGATRVTARGGAYTSSAARGRAPPTTARRCNGTGRPTGRSAPATRAWAAQSRSSGTR